MNKERQIQAWEQQSLDLTQPAHLMYLQSLKVHQHLKTKKKKIMIKIKYDVNDLQRHNQPTIFSHNQTLPPSFE